MLIGNYLKVQSRKLYNNKYMTALTQITKTFVAVLAFKLLLNRKVLFTVIILI